MSSSTKPSYYERNRERILADLKAKYASLTEEEREVHRARHRARHQANKAEANRGRRDRYLKYTYGITLEQYEEIEAAQNGICAICDEPCQTFKRLCVDHDHTTGKIRGLLCSKHNRAMGLFGDNPEMLEKAITYILNAQEYE